MTNQEFYEFQTAAEGSARSYINNSDGTSLVTCGDGTLILVEPTGDSREISAASAAQKGYCC